MLEEFFQPYLDQKFGDDTLKRQEYLQFVMDSCEGQSPSYYFVYNKPIHGYNVRMSVFQIDQKYYKGYLYTGALLLSKNNTTVIAPIEMVELSDFLVSTWDSNGINHIDYDETLEDYCGGLFPHMGQYSQLPFFFFDVDFDGEKELILRYYNMGQRGRNVYYPVKLYMEDTAYFMYYNPFDEEDVESQDYLYPPLDDMTQFDSVSQTITFHLSAGAWGNEWHIYRMQNPRARLACKITEESDYSGITDKYYLTKETHKQNGSIHRTKISLDSTRYYDIHKLIRQVK